MSNNKDYNENIPKSVRAAIVGRVRRASVSCDSDRKASVGLVDKMASLACQVALVARMGDDDSLSDVIDDSEHILTNTHVFSIKSESHQLNGDEAFSFDMAFDGYDGDTSINAGVHCPGSFFEFAKCCDDGRLQIDHGVSVKIGHLESYVSVVGVLILHPVSNVAAVLSSLLPGPNSSSTENDKVPSARGVVTAEGMTPGNIYGMWNEDASVLYLVTLCYTDPDAGNESCIYNAATLISLISSSLMVYMHSSTIESSNYSIEKCIRNISRSVEGAVSYLSKVDPSSHIISAHLFFLLDEPLDTTALNDLVPRVTDLITSFHSAFDAVVLPDAEMSNAQVTKTSLFLVDTRLDKSTSPVITGCAESTAVKCYDMCTLQEEVLGSLQHKVVCCSDVQGEATKSIPSDPVDSQSESEDEEDIPNSGMSSGLTGRAFMCFLSALLMAVEATCHDSTNGSSQQSGQIGSIAGQVSEKSEADDTISDIESTLSPEVLSRVLEKYKSVMLQKFLDPSHTPPTLSLYGDQYIDISRGDSQESLADCNSARLTLTPSASDILRPDFDEVDDKVSQEIESLHCQAYDTAMRTYRNLSSGSTDSVIWVASALENEKAAYWKHIEERSYVYCEGILRDSIAELSMETFFDTGEATSDSGNKEYSQAEKLSELLQVYFHRARGPAKRIVISRYLDTKLQNYRAGGLKSENDSLKEQIKQYQITNSTLRAKVESLATENSQLHETMEDKTDKALDAWAALQEKYAALEKSTLQLQQEKQQQSQYIEKLKAHIAQVEKVNAAMKHGVEKLLREEDEEDYKSSRSGTATNMTGNSFGQMLSFALACATGGPLDHDDDSLRWEHSAQPAPTTTNCNSGKRESME
mmetsp:Transcript_9615/g.14472  ORF Transcript_9615/g.14472 Transcript_9615/m.14472 type:complete len:867 (+) Transcript_9615:91-2691(+)